MLDLVGNPKERFSHNMAQMCSLQLNIFKFSRMETKMIRRFASFSSVFYLHRGVERDLDLERILQPATFETMLGNAEKLGRCQAEWYYK